MTTLERAIDIVGPRLFADPDATVMVARGGLWETRRRHVRLRRDDDGFYVRLGKRGGLKVYLLDMAGARIVDAGLGVVVFHEP